MKKYLKIILIATIAIFICILVFFISNSFHFIETGTRNKTNNPPVLDTSPPYKELTYISRTTNLVTINASVADFSRITLPGYQGVLGKNNSIDLRLKSSGDTRRNVTSEEEAPEAARKIMESHGGLPPDAEFDGASTHYSRDWDYSVNKYVSEEPMFTSISYSQRKINGYWIVGDSNRLLLDLGENGEPLWISKIWRNYSYSGDVPIIPLDTAIEKLDRLELVHSEWHPEAGDITIHNITLGYYTEKIEDNATRLEPVWMFYGSNATTGVELGFYVYARQFANFTASPVSGKAPLNVIFTDTSETSLGKWLWDFGDGMNSTLRNPMHTYRNAGLYNITLTVWNDLGSDTLSKQVEVIP